MHRLALTTLCLVPLAACGVPRDRAGTLERLSGGGEARIGVATAPPWATTEGGVGGVEPALAAAWARSIGARPRFTPGPETDLVERLHKGELDVLVAGLEKGTPHAKKLALSQVYLNTTVDSAEPGKPVPHVMAVRQGESATLFSLDRFLLAQDRAAIEREAAR